MLYKLKKDSNDDAVIIEESQQCNFSRHDANSILTTILNNTVQDYFTPNIRAEIILDMLLTDIIAPLVQYKLTSDSNIRFIAKEMSLPLEASANYGNRGPKIDFVLEGEKNIYLVELKTSQGSQKDSQLDIYKGLIDQSDHSFNVLVEKLIDILSKGYNKPISTENKLDDLKELLVSRIANYGKIKYGRSFVENAIGDPNRLLPFMQDKNIHSTNKYFFTAAQILKARPDFNKEMKLVYISPNGIEDKKLACDITFQDIKDYLASNSSNPYCSFLQKIFEYL